MYFLFFLAFPVFEHLITV